MRPNLLSVMLLSAGVLVLAAGCQTTPTQQGAVLGGALGAGAGAIIGNQSGHSGEGALIGAAAGGLTGALVGDQVDENRQRRAGQNQRPATRGHYETRIVTTTSGETYEERVWVPDQ
ncbi:MAG: glycine zipper 2TM domain-containing protein [Nitrospiraceae bacterium]|nr:glycine zipper 2TM domain-containing protein [Nitrospiraceae bacterium]